MFRIFFFLLLVLGLGFLFAWVADNPGLVFVRWEWLSLQMTGETGNEFGIPLTLAIAVLILLIATIMLVTGFLRGIFAMPTFITKFFENRRKDRGYKALSTGLIAASSGDVDMARQASKESGKLLGNDPLVALLSTQTALLEGNREEAKQNFQKMLENEDTRLVALRGLFLEAERQGEPTAARHYAEEAVRSAPSLPWAGNAKLSYQASDEDWDAAIVTLDANRAAGLINKQDAKRQRAVLLTAKAMVEEAANPDNARSLAKQAHKLAPDLVPAAIVYASSAARLGDIKGASKVVEATWKVAPHPELAQAYSVVRPGDSVQDRLKRARKLADIKPKDPESCMALAIAAIDAQEWEEARTALAPVLTTAPTERACLLMADIEEGQHGDEGRMRDWLSRAVRSHPNPVWVADGHVSEHWMPVSPITGAIDAFEWKVPLENLEKISAPVMTLEELQEQAKPIPAKPVIQVEEEVVEITENTSEPDTEIVAEVKAGHKITELKSVVAPTAAAIAAKATGKYVEQEPEPETTEAEIVETVEVTATNDLASNDNEAIDEETESDAEEAGDVTAEKETTETTEVVEVTKDEDRTSTDEKPEEPKEVAASTEIEKPETIVDEKRNPPDQPADKDNTVKFPLDRRPDDPGVHPDKVPPKKKGFGLF